MASPAVAHSIGVGAAPHRDVDMTDVPAHSPSNSALSPNSIKRKRELSINGAVASHPNGVSHASKDKKAAIRDYLLVLERFDATPSLLKRPLPADQRLSDEPSAKRTKAEDGSPLLSIADKAAKDEYADLESVVADIKASVKDQLSELRAIQPDKVTKTNDEAIAKTFAFDQKARELFRREISYPNSIQNPSVLRALDSATDLQSNASGNMVLSVYGEAPRPRQLYSSLQQPVVTPENPLGSIRPLRENGLPKGIKTTKAIAFSFPSAVEKDKRAKTLGELFPTPRGLPSLQPPKAPKSTTKGVQVGWHRPELTEKSKYRSGSYFGQTISTGRWLDYSNAAPPSQIMTKQRERAMSLAGAKPSSSDLETSEMESLFRGAFSSFAPSKDDSAAMISSGLISQTMWWQKYGKRSLDRLVETEATESAADKDSADDEKGQALDDTFMEELIEKWDSKIDPSLEEMCNPKKAQEEQDVDDILQEVSDMIQTLISFQKNRNLTLPNAANQSRYAADPAHSDMLTNGSPVQPSEEETLTYETLKAQLILVIQMLPPFAVARLNSDKLEELNISTKLEIRADEYQGIMEEDEAAARTRAAQQTPAPPRTAPHRSSSSTSQFNAQYGGTGSRAAMPSPGYYNAQSAARTPSGAPRPQQAIPPAYPQQRTPSNAGYRPTPNGYSGNTNFAQQLARAQQSFSQASPYVGTPPQNRPPYQQPPPYQNMGNANQPPRFPAQASPAPVPHYPQHGYPQQQQQQQPGTPSHPPPYNPYPNGAKVMPPRTASPQVTHQQPQYMQNPGFNPNGTPSRQPSYAGQAPMGPNPQQRYYPPAGSPQMPQGNVPNPNQPNAQQAPSFHTSLHPHQVQQAMDQAKARFDARTKAQEGIRSIPPQGQHGPPPGARPNFPGAVNYSTPSPSPKPQSNPAVPQQPVPPMNGSPAVTPVSTNGAFAPPPKQA
ncbi:hypothetical protein BX600DRAFT_434981 [Xylariales sp. PMI_506]|nr:hypothetical protein BX600DRAFT_434981 [Xylariales sp. PMI_506]